LAFRLHLRHGVSVRRFTDLRAWQACDAYKKAIDRLIKTSLALRTWSRRGQLEKSLAGPPAHVSEGFGRFSPPDFARYCVIARSSLMESQNHLIDAVDSECIDEETRIKYNALAEVALEEVTGLMDYLQSPEALRNARRARERRIARRQVADENGKSVGADPNLELGNLEPRTKNRTPKRER
jgi:four helix bundle protein